MPRTFQNRFSQPQEAADLDGSKKANESTARPCCMCTEIDRDQVDGRPSALRLILYPSGQPETDMVPLIA